MRTLVTAIAAAIVATSAANAYDECQFRTETRDRVEAQLFEKQRLARDACPWPWSRALSEKCSAAKIGEEMVEIVLKMAQEGYMRACFKR